MLNLIVFAFGCNPNIEKMETREEDIVEIQDTADVGSYSLLIELDTQSTLAGENVSYTLSFLDPSGEMVDDFRWELSSSVESALQWTSKQIIEDVGNTEEEALINGVGNIRPLVAGVHDLLL